MPIKFACACGKHIRAPDNAVGRRSHCPRCGDELVVPHLSTLRETSRRSTSGTFEVPAPVEPGGRQRPREPRKTPAVARESVWPYIIGRAVVFTVMVNVVKGFLGTHRSIEPLFLIGFSIPVFGISLLAIAAQSGALRRKSD